MIAQSSSHSLYYSLPPPGAIGQLLDSLEEIQVLTGANDEDVNFLQNFFEHQTLQALLEVRKFVLENGNSFSIIHCLKANRCPHVLEQIAVEVSLKNNKSLNNFWCKRWKML